MYEVIHDPAEDKPIEKHYLLLPDNPTDEDRIVLMDEFERVCKSLNKKPMNELVKIEPIQLEEVVKNSGLQIAEADEIKKSYLPFLIQLAETQSQASKINFENPGELDETIARELRLRSVKIRTGAEKLKDERKRMYLLRGNLEQASFNIIAASCKLTEEIFVNVEKAREIAEKKRKEQLRIDRETMLLLYTETASMYPLGEMSEDQFNELYSGLRIVHENKIAAEKKAEEDRITKEKADVEAREAQRLENIRLKKEVEEKERLAEIEREKNAKILADQKAKAEKEHAELLAKAQAKHDKQEAIIIEQEKKVKEERYKREKAEAELKTKKEAEAKVIADAEKARKAEEKKAKFTPDKTKLLNFVQAINNLERPNVKSIEAADIASKANTYLVQCANYIRDNANKL